jgi:Protein of unknown function (DUF2815)
MELKLKNLRCSFPELGEPRYYQDKKQRENDQRRWSITLLIPYSDPQLKLINDAIEATAKDKWGAKAPVYLENMRGDSKLRCLSDGKTKAYDGYADHWALTAHRKENDGRPLVLDSDRSPIYQPNNEIYPGKQGRIYAGCYVNAHLNFWTQDNSNGRAVRADFLGVQRMRDGDAFSGGMRPNEGAFDDVSEGADASDLL